MIDTHCHLEMSAFDGDREDVLTRAREAGLEAFLAIGSDFEGSKGAVALAEKNDDIFAVVGMHPHDAKDFTNSVFDQIKMWAAHRKVVAVGEIGLDYHYDYSPRAVQRDIFRQQLVYAGESGLPVVVHCRDAGEDTLAILKDSGVDQGVMHCFSGDSNMAERVLEMGFHISFAGQLTFRKASQLRDIAKTIPDERLLIETDAPFLAPEPLRGKRNEPAFIVYTARFLAELRGVSLEDIDRLRR